MSERNQDDDAVRTPTETFALEIVRSKDDAQVRVDLLPSIERYQLLAEIGRGGMGTVYRARDRETDDLVAIKILGREIVEDPGLAQRVKNELLLARKITHKNVCRVFDLYRSGSLMYISMELVDGENLRQVLEHGTLTLSRALDLACQICVGLHEAHSMGIIHRDLKPENVMLSRSGVVKVMDFGVARSLNTCNTATGTLIGTPQYMAPEQAQGIQVDKRADIYSLGLVLYELFTGVAAFTAATPVALAVKQIRELPVHPRVLEPSLPITVEKAILRCLQKDPDRRFQSVMELEAALSTASMNTTVTSQRSTAKGHLSFLTASPRELPSIPRHLARTLVCLIQMLLLTFYLLALWKLHRVTYVAEGLLPGASWLLIAVVIITAAAGIAVRLYIFCATILDYLGLGQDFHRAFLSVLILDELWALSPLLLTYKIGVGPAIAAAVALFFLPFSQRTLLRMAYDSANDSTSR